MINYRDVDIRVHSYVRTHFRNSYTTTPWNRIPGPDEFQRTKRNVERTLTHESIHQELDRRYYEKNRDAFKRDFDDRRVYGSQRDAQQSLEQKGSFWQNDLKNYEKGQHSHFKDEFGPPQPAERSTDKDRALDAKLLDAELELELAGFGGGNGINLPSFPSKP